MYGTGPPEGESSRKVMRRRPRQPPTSGPQPGTEEPGAGSLLTSVIRVGPLPGPGTAPGGASGVGEGEGVAGALGASP